MHIFSTLKDFLTSFLLRFRARKLTAEIILIRRLRRSFVHVEAIVKEGSEGHNLQRKSPYVPLCTKLVSLTNNMTYFSKYGQIFFKKLLSAALARALTSLWCVFGFCTVLRLMDMTVSGGGGRSFTKEIMSLLRAKASTLHQLTGWFIISTTDRVDMSELQTARRLHEHF